ncbi:carboxymuconolactone decarboxylase family protein [Thalassolituus marinus]|uniref:Carboxymuconolactone decarboxylase family protein n=1 Tax=Thalassolituus marinus TaxID=671053 RepID=A0ABS7ZPZ9_9GAMM|nr:carboxymuconolactone decarboxylase family protein [Thalassolituus marinus]MCA6063787.1 carboxymuconolactone decarboxylase family protein [Thalassolituus marinus]
MTDRFEKGLKIRREVMGDAFVDKALDNATAFTMPLQKLVSEFCWGDVWGREGLSKRERSLLNLAMISVLNRQQELAGHVRGAINNGVTPEEIREVLLQVLVYAGAPTAIDSFRTASAVLTELGIDLNGMEAE